MKNKKEQLLDKVKDLAPAIRFDADNRIIYVNKPQTSTYLYSIAKDAWFYDYRLMEYEFPFDYKTGPHDPYAISYFILKNGWDFHPDSLKNIEADYDWYYQTDDGDINIKYSSKIVIGKLDANITPI